MHISKLSQYFPVGQKPCLSYTREKNKNGKTFLNKSWPRSGNNSNLSQNFVKGFVCCLRQEQESIFIKLLSKLPFTNKKKDIGTELYVYTISETSHKVLITW